MSGKNVLPTEETTHKLLALIVDDEPTTRLLLRIVMQKEGFQVVEASNGKECLECFDKHHPDIILLDAMMPEMDGFSCCAALKKISQETCLPILMITSLDDATSIERIFEAGAADYAAKPIHWALLRQRVRSLQGVINHQRAERKIEASLREKESLLKEIHHRVKNNLQIISSLLNLQANTVEDEKISDLLRESQNRVRLMSIVHEKLYQADDIGKIDLRDYIQVLTSYLMRSYDICPGRINLEVEVDDISVEIDTAVSCGLIINELVSNSLKYAFPQGKTGNIKINSTVSNSTTFSVRYIDDGIGLPQALDVRELNTLGLQLVHNLCEQLGGHLEIKGVPRTEFRLNHLLLSG